MHNSFIVCELKRGADPAVIENQLYEFTPLQSTLSIMNIALVNRQPRTLSLLELLRCYIDHRVDVIERRTRYLLHEAAKKAHILEGLIYAVCDIDEVIAIIRSSRTREEAISRSRVCRKWRPTNKRVSSSTVAASSRFRCVVSSTSSMCSRARPTSPSSTRSPSRRITLACFVPRKMMPLREPAGTCRSRDEWFVAGTEVPVAKASASDATIRLRQPTPGLQLAYDPRLPAESQVFEFALKGAAAADRVQWIVDGRAVEQAGATYRWNVTRGDHRVAATVWRGGEIVARVADTDFHVK